MKRRLLVVDDEPSIAKIVRKQLEVAGYEVTVAVDGLEGLTIAREALPELIVLDVMLPKMNGVEVCSTLKQDPKTRQIPILMLTAKAQRQDQDTGLQAGADAFLTKPFQLEELLEKVKTLLERSGGPPQTVTDATTSA
ncbi:MAG: response regulator [Candidatus Omnitrophica bacterium]|nr:response regulator [Candidatus Omnitrophota bacterium]